MGKPARESLFCPNGCRVPVKTWRMRSPTALAFTAVFLGCQHSNQPVSTPQTPFVLTVEALSRGKGVPEAAREAFGECRALVESAVAEGAGIDVSQNTIGLEGEVQLRLEFADHKVGQALAERLRAVVEGVELINVAQVPPGS